MNQQRSDGRGSHSRDPARVADARGANAAELLDDIPQAAQRMWTSALSLQGREFCYILNFAVRDDGDALVEPAAIITRAINRLCVQQPRQQERHLRVSVYHPMNDVCFRGGGFNDEFRDFFEPVSPPTPAVAHS